jgi:hypothetical protein
MSTYKSVALGVLLAVASAATTLLGLVAGVYATIHLGLALHGQYDYYAYDSPVGYALMLGGAALGAGIPLAVRGLSKRARIGIRSPVTAR